MSHGTRLRLEASPQDCYTGSARDSKFSFISNAFWSRVTFSILSRSTRFPKQNQSLEQDPLPSPPLSESERTENLHASMGKIRGLCSLDVLGVTRHLPQKAKAPRLGRELSGRVTRFRLGALNETEHTANFPEMSIGKSGSMTAGSASARCSKSVKAPPSTHSTRTACTWAASPSCATPSGRSLSREARHERPLYQRR